jgi:hypothetical protein
VAVRPAPAPSPIPVAVIGVEAVDVPNCLARPQVTGRAASGEVVVAENLASLLPDRRRPRVLREPSPG